MPARSPINVLWVSIAFPPKNDPEALQVAKCMKYLTRFTDLAVDVVTSADPTLWMSVDPALSRYAEGCRQRVEVPIFEPRLLSIALVKFAWSWIMLPDSRLTFHLRWRSVVKALAHRPDVIVSRSFPLSATIMAEKLKRHYRVPWVLHLTDPWIDSPIIRFTGLSREYNRRAQARCFTAADRISLASPRMVDFYRRRYPEFASKFVLFPNVYDRDDVPQASERAPGGALRVNYTGSLTGERSIGPFLEALKRLPGQELERINVTIAGPMDSGNRALIHRAALPNVRCIGKVPFEEARRLQQETDVLLVIDNPLGPEESMFLPSKLIDYMITRNPVLAITSPGSMTRDLVRGASGGSFSHEDAAGIAGFLSKKLDELSRGAPVHGSAPLLDREYEASHHVALFHDLLSELAA